MLIPESTEAKGVILIVDDTLENLEVLDQLLTEEGYDVRQATDGPMALMGVEADPPDLVLLDIMMPEMNGYEVCQQLKSKPETWDIPVIFISALDDAFDKVKAFELGGVDYIPKPFQALEALARVRNQMAIANLQRIFQQNTEQQFSQFQDLLTHRNQLEQSLSTLEQQSQDKMAKAPYGMYRISPDGHYVQMNPALSQIYGYETPQHWRRDLNAQEIPIPYADLDQWKWFLSLIETQGKVVSLKSAVFRRDGQETMIVESARPVKDEAGTLLYFEGIAQELKGEIPFHG